MQRYTVNLYLETALHVSGGTSTHHQEGILLYLQHLVFVTPLLLSATIVEELEPVWVCCGWRTCVLIFFTAYFWNSSHSKKNWATYDQKCMLVFMWSSRYSCQISIKLDFSRQIFEKCSNTKFHENPYSWSRVVPCAQTWRRFLLFAVSRKAPRKGKGKNVRLSS
jgi:hypothetical protein